MVSKVLQISLFIFLSVIFVLSASAQSIKTCAYVDNIQRTPREEKLPDNIRDRLMELCIEDNKKEFQELVSQTEEVAKISEQIEESYTKNKKLSSEDKDKLKEANKLLKDIRKELRADDNDEDEDEKPKSIKDAIKDLRENTTNLLDEIKKTTRHSISAAAIQSSNTVLKIIKFLRLSN